MNLFSFLFLVQLTINVDGCFRELLVEHHSVHDRVHLHVSNAPEQISLLEVKLLYSPNEGMP